MILQTTEPAKALNRPYSRQSVKREEIDLFKKNLLQMFQRINDAESEEHNKNIVSDFLKDTYYKNEYEINTSGRKDLVIHTGKTSAEPVGVILEAKKPSNKADMISLTKPNAKALHELLHYYMQERLVKKNIHLTHLIITDIYQWYIFDAAVFERIFFQNKQFQKDYTDWNNGALTDTTTDWFYLKIAKEFIENEISALECCTFNLNDYVRTGRDLSDDDNNLIDLYKILSPTHLLKQNYANDSNVLNKDFYNELLHIIGLCEQKRNGKKLIERLPAKERNEGSLLENTISILKTYDKLANVINIEEFGDTEEEQIFSISLELCITWINRILFLKLLEGQLIKYNAPNGKDFAFLHTNKIQDFDELSELFFDVLAVKTQERTESIRQKYANIPYLNSSLFEISPLERQTISINQLKDRFELPIFAATVLKEEKSGERKHGKRATLQYLLEFLDAYDFASETSKANIQEQNKTIINAAVLGLIFEKINGYKDGSFFTPGFITMYMCRETIRKAVLRKFNLKYKWECKDIDSLYNYLAKEKLKEYSDLINTVRICDPAVGSGHFLVSALNELLAIKFNLEVVLDRNGKVLRGYKASVENDEFHLSADDTEIKYIPKNHESQRLQEAIFHEKQTIIENCLFGVDINSKSVQICRLRLWIELLKHAYYMPDMELQTLPNIDINIKCGNSLISRFALNGGGFAGANAQKMQLATRKYKEQVLIYKNTTDKATRKQTEKEIARIKEEFSAVVNPNDEDLKKLRQKQAELGQAPMLFTKEEKTQWELKVTRLAAEVAELEKTYNEKIKSTYGNAFEWRFEFPEVLDDNGNFAGFDVVVGNPPYYQIQYSNFDFKSIKNYYKTYEATGDIYSLFIEKALQLIKKETSFSYIVSNRFCNTNYGYSTRKFLSEFTIETLININNVDVFDEANVGTIILRVRKEEAKEDNTIVLHQLEEINPKEQLYKVIEANAIQTKQKYFNEKQWIFKRNEILEIKQKMEKKGKPLFSLNDLNINRGITTGANNIFIIDNKTKEELCKQHSSSKDIIKLLLKGKDIKRFLPNNSSEWIIFTRRGMDIEKYPAIKEFLLKSKEELEPGVGRKKGSYKWFEIQDNTAFYKEFEKEKLIWTRLSSINSFAISTNSEYSLDSTSFATGKNLKYYCAILNSKAILFYFKLGSVIWGKDGIKWFGDYFDNIPIPLISEAKQKPFIRLVDTIIAKKQADSKADTSAEEAAIDKMVYELYNLTPDEIKIVEPAP